MPARIHAPSLALAALLVTAAGAAAAAAADTSALLPEKNLCADPAGPVALGNAQWNGWGRDLDNTRYQPEPALRATDVPKLALKWAFGYQGSAGAGQPTIVDGRVFVTSAKGRVYSLDSRTGCTYWTYDAQAGIRTAISIGELAPQKQAPRPKKSKRKRTPAHLDVRKAPSAVFFGDDRGAVYALDAEKGTLLWKTQVEGHATARIQGTPVPYQNRLYVAVASSEPSAAAESTYPCCTFRGSVAALDMANGNVLWKTHTVTEEPRPYGKNGMGIQELGPAGVPVLASPTIDIGRGLVYVATGSSFTAIEEPLADAVVAFALEDGKLRWAKQPPRQQGEAAEFDSSPILRTLASGKQVILAGPRSGVVYGLDPERGGEILWRSQAAEGEAATGGVEWGPAADHHSLYVALSGHAGAPEDRSGSLIALDLKTGAKRWQTIAPTPACTWGDEACSHAQAQAVTVIPGVAFSGSMDGHLRAYSTIDGKIVWDYETAKDFTTVNGVKASGGSLDQGGATIVNGVVYVNSGNGQQPTGQPGNVLLAFSVEGR
ncbi:MAG: PQQ-binding-like beta-propeller repeat protein [Steroidobacteraceae bacterium]